MKTKEYLVLFALAALWGASFLFIKVAVAEMSPALVVGARLVIGASGLLLVIAFKPAIMHGWHTRLKAFALVTFFNTVIPYLAISWGEQHVTSGMAAILNATTPLALIIISLWWPGGEPLTRYRLLAVVLGFLGVALLVGPAALQVGQSNLFLLGAFACLIGAISYAVGSLLVHQLLKGLPLMQQAIGQIGTGALIMLPITGLSLALQPQTHIPSFWPIAATLALALGGTSLAYLCYFWLIENVGATRTLIVTYLLPCMALIYGALLLHENIGINAIGGLALVLIGIFLAGKKTVQQRTAKIEGDRSSPPEKVGGMVD